MKLNFNPYLEFQYFKTVKPFLKILNDPMKVQNDLLFNILKNNKNTQFGQINNFDKIKNIKDYQNLIKISNYDDIKSYVDLLKIGIQFDFLNIKIDYFTITSGTTSFPKFIPHTQNYINLRKKSWGIWHSITYKLKPETYSLDSSLLTFTSKKKDGNTLGGQEYGVFREN